MNKRRGVKVKGLVDGVSEDRSSKTNKQQLQRTVHR